MQSIEMQQTRHSNPRADTPTTARHGGTTVFSVTPPTSPISPRLPMAPTQQVQGTVIPTIHNATPENAITVFKEKLEAYFNTTPSLTDAQKKALTQMFDKIIHKIKEKQPEHWHNIVASPHFMNNHTSALHTLYNDNDIININYLPITISSALLFTGGVMSVLSLFKEDLKLIRSIGYGVASGGVAIFATAMTRAKYNNYKRTNDTINRIANNYVPDGAVAMDMHAYHNGVANGVPARMQPVADGVPVTVPVHTNNIRLPADIQPVRNPYNF